jgi:hypothetical protein
MAEQFLGDILLLPELWEAFDSVFSSSSTCHTTVCMTGLMNLALVCRYWRTVLSSIRRIQGIGNLCVGLRYNYFLGRFDGLDIFGRPLYLT